MSQVCKKSGQEEIWSDINVVTVLAVVVEVVAVVVAAIVEVVFVEVAAITVISSVIAAVVVVFVKVIVLVYDIIVIDLHESRSITVCKKWPRPFINLNRPNVFSSFATNLGQNFEIIGPPL